MWLRILSSVIRALCSLAVAPSGGQQAERNKKKTSGTYVFAHQFDFIFTEYQGHDLVPLSILTATVLQLVVLSIPNADACITLPKAPRPRGFPEREGRGETRWVRLTEGKGGVFLCLIERHY